MGAFIVMSFSPYPKLMYSPALDLPSDSRKYDESSFAIKTSLLAGMINTAFCHLLTCCKNRSISPFSSI